MRANFSKYTSPKIMKRLQFSLFSFIKNHESNVNTDKYGVYRTVSLEKNRKEVDVFRPDYQNTP